MSAYSAVLVTWTLAGPGAMETHIITLARGLVREGFDVTLIVASAAGLPSRVRTGLTRAGIRIESVPPLERVRTLGQALRHQIGNRLRRFLGQPEGVACHIGHDLCGMLRRRIARGRPDVIHLHSWRLGLAGIEAHLDAGPVFVITEHASPAVWTPPTEPDAAAAGRSPMVAAVHSGMDVVLREYRNGPIRTLAPPDRPGIATARLVARGPGDRGAFRVVAAIGNARERVWIVEAVARARDAVDIDLTILDGAEPALGPIGEIDLLCVTPGFPSAIRAAADAMAAGVPLAVGGRIAGLGLEHRANAMIVDPDCPAALADTLRQLAGDPLLAQALAVAARRRAGHLPVAEQAAGAEAAALYREAGAFRG